MQSLFFIIERFEKEGYMKEITESELKQFEAYTNEDKDIPALQAAASETDLETLAYQKQHTDTLNGAFAIDVKTRGITNQQKSGRCWEFSALNLLREYTAEKMNLRQFEFSQNYLSFYDKLEKCNNWLNMFIEHRDEDWHSDMLQYLLNGISDGNVWDQPAGLIQKYGLVPKEVMGETWASNHTSEMNVLLNQMLKKDALILKDTPEDQTDTVKEKMMAEIYRFECIMFGHPVKEFDYAYRDENDVYHKDYHLTPHSFYDKYVGIDLSQYVHIINEPTPYEPMHRVIESHDNGNMAEQNRRRLNLPWDEFEALLISQLKDNQPVWIGLDAGAFINRKDGVWDQESYVYEPWLKKDMSFTKGERLMLKISSPTHNVLLTGVDFDEEGKPVRWKIENSWGKESGKDGFFTASEAYFKEYVYEAAVQKKYMNEEQKEALKKESVVLKPWELEQF